jgi:hypothetical protein
MMVGEEREREERDTVTLMLLKGVFQISAWSRRGYAAELELELASGLQEGLLDHADKHSYE